MRKIVAIGLAFFLCIGMILPGTAFAASATAGMSGPSTVRAGDTITVSFQVTGSGIFGVSGTLSYDSSQLTLQGTAQKIGSPWMVEFNGNNFVAYDNNLTNPINGTVTVFTATFRVGSVAAGANLAVSCQNVKASDGNADINVGTVTYSVAAAAPLATNNSLSSLTVSNATISPAFSASTTNYTAEVPFEVSKLSVSAVAEDSKAKVTINSPTLVPNGTTKVTVTVTAESGAQKVYTISVKRPQDPNYVPSGNNDLAGIEVEGFLLSPVFDASVLQYMVWLPYEVSEIKVSGTPADSLASVEIVGGDNLAAGQDNPVKVICTAENGEKKEYVILAKRAAAHDGSVESLPEEPVGGETPEAPSSGGLAWWYLPIVGGGGLIAGAIVGFFGGKLTKKKQDE